MPKITPLHILAGVLSIAGMAVGAMVNHKDIDNAVEKALEKREKERAKMEQLGRQRSPSRFQKN